MMSIRLSFLLGWEMGKNALYFWNLNGKGKGGKKKVEKNEKEQKNWKMGENLKKKKKIFHKSYKEHWRQKEKRKIKESMKRKKGKKEKKDEMWIKYDSVGDEATYLERKRGESIWNLFVKCTVGKGWDGGCRM